MTDNHFCTRCYTTNVLTMIYDNAIDFVVGDLSISRDCSCSVEPTEADVSEVLSLLLEKIVRNEKSTLVNYIRYDQRISFSRSNISEQLRRHED